MSRVIPFDWRPRMQVLPGGKGKKRPLPLFVPGGEWTAVQMATVRVFGLETAFFLHRLEWRLGVMPEDDTGRRWTYRSWPRWHLEDLPFMRRSRFFQIVADLKAKGILLVRSGTRETRWQNYYSLDCEKLREALGPLSAHASYDYRR